MTALNLDQAIDNICNSVNNDNEDLDLHIAALKTALSAAGAKEIVIDPARLTHNNREGRKLMQSFFRKRGITVTFKA